EVMGRYGSLGNGFGNNIYTPLDLFRYASAGTRALTPGPGWFSIDGQNLLKQFNNPANGEDAGDWLPVSAGGSTGDSYGSNGTNVVSRVTGVDLRVMNIIGYDRRSLTADDVNGNGVSDILFWNHTSGDFTFANMQGSLLNWNDIGASNTAYTLVGTGDFFANRVSDVLFRNDSTGDTWFSAMSTVGTLAGWE